MYKDLQANLPIFIKSRHYPLTWQGKTFEYNQHLPWQEMNISYDTVRLWFIQGIVYHNQELEKQSKVGDRLSELDNSGLSKLVEDINNIVKSRTNSTSEFNSKKCKKSKIDDKQRGLIRSFLRNNAWIEDEFYILRDNLLED